MSATNPTHTHRERSRCGLIGLSLVAAFSALVAGGCATLHAAPAAARPTAPRPAAPSAVQSTANLRISQAPQAHQLYPRNPATNKGTVPVAGDVTGVGVDTVRLDVTRDRDGKVVTSRSITVARDGRTFAFSVQLDAGLESYTLSLYTASGGAASLEARWPDIVSGDAFLINGQSNAAAAKRFASNPNNPADTSNSSAADRSPWIRTFGSSTADPTSSGSDDEWREADGDAYQTGGAVGQYGLRLARRIVDAYRIPVALLNGANDAEPIGFFQRDDGDPHDLSTNYGRLLDRATRSGLQNQIRGILWYQGESDDNDVAAQSTGFATLLDGWKTDYPGVTHVYVHQLRNGCLTPSGVPQPSYEEREAQRQYEDTLGVTVLSTNGIDGRGPDDCHYYYVGGYATLADHDFLAVARDYYGGSAAATTAPDPRAAWFSNAAHTEITIQLRNSSDAITVGCGAADDFLVNGHRVPMVVAAGPGYVGLRLESPVDSATAVNISYLGHDGAGPWVANANGIGLLTFYQLPLTADHTNPFPTLLSCPS